MSRQAAARGRARRLCDCGTCERHHGCLSRVTPHWLTGAVRRSIGASPTAFCARGRVLDGTWLCLRDLAGNLPAGTALTSDPTGTPGFEFLTAPRQARIWALGGMLLLVHNDHWLPSLDCAKPNRETISKA